MFGASLAAGDEGNKIIDHTCKCRSKELLTYLEMTHLVLLAIALLLELVSGDVDKLDVEDAPTCTGHGCNHTNRNVGIYVGLFVSFMCIGFILMLTIFVVVFRYIQSRKTDRYMRIPN